MKPYFITGTDTDCGKTYATCQLLQYLNDKGLNTEAIKPIASGCDNIDGILTSSDAVSIKKHSQLSLDEINPWRFKLPVSPHIAADAENKTLIASEIVKYCLSNKWQALDRLLIEGAGGLLVPLNWQETWLDFLKQSQIPIILVVGIKLGCINHALLTESMLINNNLNCVGWVANHIKESQDLMERESCLETLRIFLKSPMLAEIPHNGGVIDNKLSNI